MMIDLNKGNKVKVNEKNYRAIILSFIVLISIVVIILIIIKNNETKDSLENDFSVQIIALYKFEDSRNFDKISTIYNDTIKRYWNSHNIDKIKLKKVYESSWSHLLLSKNRIVSINKIDNTTYIVKTEFSYVNVRTKDKPKVKISLIKIVFDDNARIVEIFDIN